MEKDNNNPASTMAAIPVDPNSSSSSSNSNRNNETHKGKHDGSQNNKKEESGDDDEEDVQSINLLLTQEEWSSSEEEEDDDDDFFGLQSQNKETASTRDSVAKAGNADGKQVNATAIATNDNTATTATACTPQRKNTTTMSVGGRAPFTPSSSSKLFRSPAETPATRTIEALSQQTSQADLRFDMSKLGSDTRTAEILVGLSQGKCDVDDEDYNSSGSSTVGYFEATKNAQQKNTKKAPKSKQTFKQSDKNNVGPSKKSKAKAKSKQPEKSKKEAAKAKSKHPEKSKKNPAKSEAKSPIPPATAKHKKNTKPKEMEPSNEVPLGRVETNRPPIKGTKPQNANKEIAETNIFSKLKAKQPESETERPTKAALQESSSTEPTRSLSKPEKGSQEKTSVPEAQAPDNQKPQQVQPQQQQERPQPEQQQEQEPPASFPTMDLTEYQIVHIVVPTTGPFGATIAKRKPPRRLMSCPDQEYCLIKDVAPGSLAHGVGLRQNDWYLQDSSGTQLATYDTVLSRVRSKERPLNLYMIREKYSLSQEHREQQKVPVMSVGADEGSTSGEASALDMAMSQEVDKILENVEANSSCNVPRPKSTKTQKGANLKERSKNTTTKKKTKLANSGSTDKARAEESDDEGTEEKIKISLPNEDDVVPFCNLCNDSKLRSRKRAVHHALCPENKCFSDSNADKILQNIIAGIDMGCQACAKAYETGKALVKTDAHIVLCPCRGDTTATDCSGDNNGKQANGTPGESSATKTKTKKQDKTNAANVSKKKKAKGTAEKKRPRDSQEVPALVVKGNITTARDATTGHFAKQSAAPDKSAEPARGTSTEPQRNKPDKTQKHKRPKLPPSDNSPDEPQCTDIHPQKHQTQSNTTRVSPAKFDPQVKQPSDMIIHPPNPEVDQTVRIQQNGSNTYPRSAFHRPVINQPLATNAGVHRSVTPVTPDDGAPCKTKWTQCEAMWGPWGHFDGDIVLMTHALGLGHIETVIDSERYELTPFAVSSKYHRTHSTPHEGYHNIRLQRDSMAMRSWGLVLKRHEFGGACLVESVEPCSPAAAAVFLGCVPGSGQATALRVNDMIIAFNGKEVGGMTVQGLYLELDTAGSSLSLTISRYKHAHHIESKTAQAEDQVMAAIDDALDDDCHLGWHHENVTGASETRLSLIASKTLDSQLQAESPLICQRVTGHESPELHNNTSVDKPESITTKNSLPPVAKDNSAATLPLLVKPKQSSTPKVVRFQSDSTNTKSASRAESLGATSHVNLKIHEDPKTPKISNGPLVHDESPVITDSQHEASHEINVDVQSGMRERYSLTDKRLEERCEPKRSYKPDRDDDDHDDDDDDDGNPACGCVCGTIHGGRFKVFWIQCDDCNAWYNVTRKCVGFTGDEVQKQGKWSCWACSPPEDDSEDEAIEGGNRDEIDDSGDDGYHSESSLETKFVRSNKRKRTSADSPPKICDPNEVIPNKTVVEVHREGSNLYGGMGHIVGSALDEDGDRYYSVKYIVEGYLDKPIYPEYISVLGWS